MNKNQIAVSFLVLLLILGTTTPYAIATETLEEDIENAIVAGLNWLAGHQDDEGFWGFPDRVGKTGFAVLKFEERAYELGYDSPFEPEYIYSENVQKGLDYIFSNVYMMDTDDPDEEPDALYMIHLEGWWKKDDTAPDRYPDLTDLVSDRESGRNNTDEVTCFVNNIGLGLQFAALGALILDKAKESGSGNELPDEWFTESVHP